MKKIALLSLGISVMLSCTGCSFFMTGSEPPIDMKKSFDDETFEKIEEYSDSQTIDLPSPEELPTGSNDASDGTELTSEEIAKFQELLSGNKYGPFMDYGYTDPTEIPWDKVLYDQHGVVWENIDDNKEVLDQYLKAENKEIDQYLGIVAEIKKPKLEEYVKKVTGTDYSEAKYPLSYWTYIPENDAYYYEVTEAYWTEYEIVSGEKSGNTYTIIANNTSNGDGKSRTFTFTMNDNDEITVISNIINWEEGADSIYEFDNEVYGKMYIYTYTEPYLYARIVNHSDSLAFARLDYNNGGIYDNFDSLKDVFYMDANADGITDVLFEGNTPNGDKASCYIAAPKWNNYQEFTDFNEFVNENIEGEITEDVLKDYLSKFSEN
jgi:hypothetical protein